jgi:hypothetical protein
MGGASKKSGDSTADNHERSEDPETAHLNLRDLGILDPQNLKMDMIKFHKMNFIFNAVNEGWAVSKRDDLYVFKKKHQQQKEVYLDSYLKKFVMSGLKMP